MSDKAPRPAGPATSVFLAVTRQRPDLSTTEKSGSLLVAVALAMSIVLGVITIWNVWVGVLRDLPPEPVEVSYDPYGNGFQP